MAVRFPKNLVQPEGSMRFGLDALLLACFAAREFGASPHFGLKNPCRDTPWLPPGPGFAAINLGCGQGASTAALLLRSENVRALGVDFSPALIDAARKNISLLNLSERAAFRVLDLSRAGAAFPRPAFDLALSNPPYWERGEGRASRDSINDTARRGEGVLSLFIRAARAALVHHGLLYLIFPASRFTALAEALGSCRFGMRKALLVRPGAEDAAVRVLVEAAKDTVHDIRFLPDLVLQEADGSSTPQALSFCPFLDKSAGAGEREQ